MNKPKIYIAGKIGFLPEHEYVANFKQGKIEAAAAGFTPVSPVDLPHDHDRTWKSYMKEDLRMLKQCDAIYMLSNWRDSRGARIEHWFAKRYGKIVLHQTVNHTHPADKIMAIIQYKGRAALVHTVHDVTCLCSFGYNLPKFSVRNSEAFPDKFQDEPPRPVHLFNQRNRVL